MSITVVEQDRMAARLAEVRLFLDERAWRLLLGAEARAIGYGGMKVVAAAAKVKSDTVSRGVHELDSGIVPDGRIRAAGAGRPSAAVADPGLVPALEELVDPETRGDPMSALRWTTKSTAHLAGGRARGELGDGGPAVEGCRVQLAGQRQDGRGQSTFGSGCPVPVHQRSGGGVPSRW
jgi:hypothetical protein